MVGTGVRSPEEDWGRPGHLLLYRWPLGWAREPGCHPGERTGPGTALETRGGSGGGKRIKKRAGRTGE